VVAFRSQSTPVRPSGCRSRRHTISISLSFSLVLSSRSFLVNSLCVHSAARVCVYRCVINPHLLFSFFCHHHRLTCCCCSTDSFSCQSPHRTIYSIPLRLILPTIKEPKIKIPFLLAVDEPSVVVSGDVPPSYSLIALLRLSL